MMTLAVELAGHCLAVVHSLQTWGEGRTVETEKKKVQGEKGERERERNYGEGETAVFYGDQASPGQLYRTYWTVPHYSCTGCLFQLPSCWFPVQRLLLNSRGA